MTRAAGRTLTLEEFLRLPEVKPAREYEDGEVTRKPMPSIWHGVIQRLLSVVLTAYFNLRPDADGGSEIRCLIGSPGRQRPYVPDYVVVLNATARGFFGNRTFQGAPDLAVEIRSPDDRPGARERKIAFYLTNGVPMVWDIDPDRRSVTLRTAHGVTQTLTDADTLDGGDILPGLRVTVREILPAVPPEGHRSPEVR
jgi:Uma2 family endonuclease